MHATTPLTRRLRALFAPKICKTRRRRSGLREMERTLRPDGAVSYTVISSGGAFTPPRERRKESEKDIYEALREFPKLGRGWARDREITATGTRAGVASSRRTIGAAPAVSSGEANAAGGEWPLISECAQEILNAEAGNPEIPCENEDGQAAASGPEIKDPEANEPLAVPSPQPEKPIFNTPEHARNPSQVGRLFYLSPDALREHLVAPSPIVESFDQAAQKKTATEALIKARVALESARKALETQTVKKSSLDGDAVAQNRALMRDLIKAEGVFTRARVVAMKAGAEIVFDRERSAFEGIWGRGNDGGVEAGWRS